MKTDTKAIKKPLNAAMYARVSTGRQENEQTIESQLDEVKKRITDDGNVLLPQNIFVDDGWSGEILARPALDQLRDLVKEDSLEVLYVYDRGRLSRTFAHQEIVIEELSDRDIKFISLHDIEADTPEGRVMQAMQGVFHEYERVKIVERMRRGKLYKARNGIIINGSPLYGYKYVRNDPREPVSCFINEDEAKAVRLIWNWFGNDKLSINQIKKRLYDLKIKPRKRKSDFWTKGPIIRILKCDTYITGKAYYNKSEAVVAKNPIKNDKYKKIKKTSRRMRDREEWIPFEVPKIMNDYSLYEKILKILDFNQKYACKRKKYNYLLSGLIYCGCGNRRSGDGSSKYGHFYYRCIDRLRSHPYPRKCTSSGVNAAVLDAVVWHELKKRLISCSVMRKYAEKWLKSFSVMNNEDMLERQRLTEMITKTEKEENRYSKAYGAGTLAFEQFQELMKDTKKRKVSYKKQLADLAEKSAQITVKIEVDELLEEVKKVIENIDFTEKFKVVRDIIDKVVVSERSGAEVWAHLPLPAIITEKLGYHAERRDSRTTKRREIDAF
ncbi:recombinase family protein [Patescibacteria group bacterium]